jgi:porin
VKSWGHASRLILPALLLAQPLAVRAAYGQNVDTPPAAINLEPPSLSPNEISPGVPPPAATGYLFDTGAPLAETGTALAGSGLYLKGFYSGTVYAVPSGGLQHPTVYFNEVFLGADLDLQKIAALDGTVVHLGLDSRFGGFSQGVNNLTGFSQGTLAGVSLQTRLTELTIDQHVWNDRVRFVVGRTTLASYFGTSDLYCQFISSICGNVVPFNFPSNSNSPFWPVATWAGEFSVWPADNYYFRAGASESNPSQYAHGGFPWNAGWGTAGATGAYVPVEVGYMTGGAEPRYPLKIDVGFYHDTSNFADPRYNVAGGKLAFSGGTPANDGSSSGVYAQYRQVIWRPGIGTARSIQFFTGTLIDTSGRSFVQNYIEAGLVAHGIFSGRPNDSAGLLFTEFKFNPRQTGALDDRIAAAGRAGNMAGTAQLVELNYGFALAPGIQLKPFTDLTFHPDQNLFDIALPDPKVQFAWAVGCQISVPFAPALGLPSLFRKD